MDENQPANSDPNQPVPAHKTNDAAPQPAPVRKRRRRWPWVILGILVVLILLVALLPTLISTGAGKSFVVSKVNDQLNGKLDIADWSIGWTSGVTLNGVKIDDEQGRRVVEVASVRVPMSLIGAARGNLDFGDTVIDKPNVVNLTIYPDGSTNLDKLVKEGADQAKPPEGEQGDGKLPDLKGKITIVDARATVTRIAQPGEPATPPVHLDEGDLVVNIPDINQPITTDGKFVYRVGQSPPGTIALAGSVDAIENNVVALDKLVADQKLTIASAELAAVEPFLQSPDAKTTLAGVANGELQLKASGLQSAGLNGQLTVQNFAYGGDALKGDLYKSKVVTLPINVTTTTSGTDTLINIQTLKVETDHVLVDVSGNAPQGALQNLADKKRPGAKGNLALAVNTKDVPGLVNSLRNTLGLQKDVQVTSGDVKLRVDVAMTENDAVVKHTLDAVAAGTNAGKPVKLDPVHLDAAVGVPDITQIALNLTSGFAQIKGGGPSLAALNLKGDIDLARLRDQLGQFTDLGQLELRGTANLDVNSKGDFTQAGGQSELNAALNLNNVVVRGFDNADAAKEINQPRVALTAGGVLVGGPGTDRKVAGAKTATVTLQTGDAASPVIDLALNITNLTRGDGGALGVEKFELAKLNVPSLPRAQKDFAAFMPSDVNLTGSLNVAAAGSYRDDTATFTALSVDTSDKYITLKKGDAPLVVQMKEAGIAGNGELAIGSDLKRLDDALKMSEGKLQSGVFNAVLKLASQPGAASTIALDGGVDQLTITTHDKPIQNEKVQLAVRASTPADFSAVNVESVIVDSSFANTKITETQIKLDADGVFDMLQRAKAQITVPDVGRTYAVIQAFQPPATQPAAAPVARAEMIEAGGWREIPIGENSVVWTSAPVVQPVLVAAQVTGSERISRPNPAPAAAAPAKPQAAPAPQPPAAPAEAPLAPLNLAGAAAVSLDLRREGNVTKIDIPQISGTKISLVRGSRSFAFDKDIALKLAAELGTKKVPTTASTQPVDAVDHVRITQLGGDLGGLATLNAPDGVVLTNLAGDQPTANGKLGVNGSLEPLTRFLSVVQGTDPMPYRGDYALTQNVRTDAGKIALVGDATVNKLVVLDTKGQPSFTEDKLVLTNDLVADTNTKTAVMNRVVLDMATSKALGVNLKGTIKDWERQRAFENVVLEMPYDLAKVWTLVRPMLSAETQESLKDLKVAGQHKSVITLGGSYPAYAADGKTELPFNEAFKSVKAAGDISVASFSHAGADIQNLVLPFNADQGMVVTVYANRPRGERTAKAASFNTGTLDLSSIIIDLTDPTGPRITIAKGHQLVAGASINKFLGDSLGKFINPVFANATRAEGLLNVTALDVKGFALGELIKSPQSGRGQFSFSLLQMDIANPLGDLLMGGLLKQVGLGSQRAETQAFRGQIRDAQVTIDRGIISENIVMEIGKRAPEGAIGKDPKEAQLFPLRFSGTINAADLRQNLTVVVPSSLLDSRDIERWFPQGIPVTLGGTTIKPMPDFGNFARQVVEAKAKAELGNLLGGDKKDGAKDPVGGVLQDILGGKKPAQQPQEQKPGSTTQPAQQPQKKDPFGGLLDQLTKPKK